MAAANRCMSVLLHAAHSCATSACRAAADLLSPKALCVSSGRWGSEDDVTALSGQRDNPVCGAWLAKDSQLLLRTRGVGIASPVQEKVSGRQPRGPWP